MGDDSMEMAFAHDFSRLPVRATGPAQAPGPEVVIDSRLPLRMPARTDRGSIHLGISGLLMPAPQRQQMLRHEFIHARHQRLAPISETAEARTDAESLAVRGERSLSGLAAADFFRPVPAQLNYPPQTYAPWSNVWIGYAGLLGEVIDSGVSVRIFLTFDELGITSRPEYQVYECGKHDIKPIPDVVKKLKQVAQKTAKMNDKIPATATTQRVALVAIYGDKSNSGYRIADSKGLIVLSREEFDAGIIESTMAHEGSHAIFEYHSLSGSSDASARAPDALAMRIADLYVKLGSTKDVPEPSKKFAKGSLPSLEAKEGTPTHAAGLVMVTDTLWSGTGGHPWHGVDEFFASAHAGFIQEPGLLKEIIEFYEKFDPAIKPLAKELLDLLATVGKPKLYEKVAAPKDPAQAKETLGHVSAPPVFDKKHPVAGWFIDPSTMPSPAKINCSVPPSSGSDTDIDKLLDELSKPTKP